MIFVSDFFQTDFSRFSQSTVLGKCSKNDYAVLSSRIVGNNTELLTSESPIIVPGNELVKEINNPFVTNHAQTSKVFVTKATDKVKKKQLEENLKLKSLPSARTGGLPSELPLFVDMPVMLTKNISTELGLTNGTTGIVKAIPLKPDVVNEGNDGIHYLESCPDYITVEFDDIVMNPLDKLPPKHVPVFTKDVSFSFTENGKKSLTVQRKHFPLVPAFSCTAHKSQGQTLNSVVIDLVPPKRMRNIDLSFVYVPLSRFRSLKDLTILRPFDFSVLTKPINSDCADMLSDFRNRDICKDL